VLKLEKKTEAQKQVTPTCVKGKCKLRIVKVTVRACNPALQHAYAYDDVTNT
jgi:hypothetical protein